jgi:hypothetical protein
MAPTEILNQTMVDGFQDGISFETCLIVLLETKESSSRPIRLGSDAPLPESMDSVLMPATAEYLLDEWSCNIPRDSEFRNRSGEFWSPIGDGRCIQLLS